MKDLLRIGPFFYFIFKKKLRENKFLAVKQSPKKCRNSSQQLRSENQQLNSSTLSCELYIYSISAYLVYAQTLFIGILSRMMSEVQLDIGVRIQFTFGVEVQFVIGIKIQSVIGIKV